MKIVLFIKLLLFSFIFVYISCGKKTRHTEFDSNRNSVNHSLNMAVIQDSLVINSSDTSKSNPISIVYDDEWGEYFLPDDTLTSDSIKVRLPFSIDSIVIEYWDSRNAREYSICIFNNTENILIREYFSGENVIIDSLDLIKSLVRYINDFYINKTKKIILSRRKANTFVSGDWPSIEVICYKNGLKISDKHTWITEENDNYRFVFNPEFLDFYELIKLLLGSVSN